MLKKVIQKNSSIIKEQLKNALGENYEVEVKWGYPITTTKFQTSKTTDSFGFWELTFNLDDDSYSIQTKSYKMEEDKEIADISVLDSHFIDFVRKVISDITSQLFVTKSMLEAEEAAKNGPKPEDTKEAELETEKKETDKDAKEEK